MAFLSNSPAVIKGAMSKEEDWNDSTTTVETTASLSDTLDGPRRSSKRTLVLDANLAKEGRDVNVARASSYRQKCTASLSHSLVVNRTKSSGLDDRFSTSLNMCDSNMNLMDLRWKRSGEPIVIHEDDNDMDEIGDSFVVQSFSHLKPMLHSPSVERKVKSLDSQSTPFVIQHIGALHPVELPQIFTM
uniref:Uncharacterized protein n=1 Tax=Entomoneis paludosa TaxID=265537 RepID=A0A7S2VE97_9STRA